MITEKKIYRLIAILISLAALTLITAIAKNVVGLNAITVALLYLLVVLVTSALAELTCGIVIAVVSGLLVNYFFLPPFGTFYSAIYLFGKTGNVKPVSSGTRPSSRSSQNGGMPPNLPSELLDVITEEGPDVQCLTLQDQGETVGALVISQVSLSREVTESIASIVSLSVRQVIPVRAVV